VDTFIHGNFGPGVSDSTLFDGIDVDWEYPAVAGHEGNVYRPEDTRTFTLLLAELRRQLDAVDPDLLLTIAAPAPERCYAAIELEQIHQYLDWINLMTYDFHGSSDATTNHHAHLYSSPADPGGDLSSDATVRGYLAAGIPAHKLILGLPFYGRCWAGVPDVNDGLYQPARWKGSQNYRTLKERDVPGFWDPVACAHWTYDGDEFCTLENETSIAHKMRYVNEHGLGGAMFWELCGDDDAGSLIAAVYDGLHS
jgi:chitinase